jgi:hypothetical protein
MITAETQSAAWALAYLRGSARGYWRGTVTLPRVTASVDLAMRMGASGEDVRRVLLQHALGWDALNKAVKPD